MGYALLNGIEIRIGARWDTDFGLMEKEQRETLNKVLHFLNERPYQYSYSYTHRYVEEGDAPRRWVPFVTVKSHNDEETRDLIDILPWKFSKERVVTHREFEICTTDDCYQPTIANGKGCALFETDMESVHDIHCDCIFHASEEDKWIATTLEVTNDTPKDPFWTKIFSFRKLDNQFYAQRVYRVNEGGWEEGELPALYPTPWCGPFATRELAIQAARDYEEEE